MVPPTQTGGNDMKKERCINCQSTVVAFIETHFEGVHFQPLPEVFRQGNYFCSYEPKEMEGTLYRFVKGYDDGSFAHFQVQQGFYEGRIYLRIDNVIVHYQQYLWNSCPCTDRILSNAGHVGMASRVPPQFAICSPWFDCENTKDGLLAALEQLNSWYKEQQQAIAASLAKQLGWIQKEDRSLKVIANFVREHAAQLNQQQVYEIYEQVERLLEGYETAYPNERKKPISQQVIFYDYCADKLPQTLRDWISQLEQPLQKAKAGSFGEPWHAVYLMLVFLHDSQKLNYPNIIRERPWTALS